jgi:hypothetical protein
MSNYGIITRANRILKKEFPNIDIMWWDLDEDPFNVSGISLRFRVNYGGNENEWSVSSGLVKYVKTPNEVSITIINAVRKFIGEKAGQ